MTVMHFQGMDALVLQAADGARATVTLHGGHLVSWIPAGGEEMLYLSPRSAFAAGQAIRGGVPVIFPQFSARGPLTRHGFARLLAWQPVRHDVEQGQARAVLRLTDDAVTRASWPYGFALELTLRVGANTLTLALSCLNTGKDSLSFSAALHTYLRTDDIDRTSVQGLTGRRYQDALDGLEKLQSSEVLRFDTEQDRVYPAVGGDLHLHELRGGHEHRTAVRRGSAPQLAERRYSSERRVQISQRGFEDVVVWNPGAAKCAALADMPADGWRHMVCVEAARIERPVVLAPGACWVGQQQLARVSG